MQTIGSPINTEESRFVLHDNGAFSLDYLNLDGNPYRGSYTEENGLLNFTWEPCCGWSATGRLEGDSLKVQYNTMMQMADFEDAVYTGRHDDSDPGVA